MLLAVLAGFIVAFLLVPAGRFLKGRYPALLVLLPLGLFIYFLGFIPRISEGNTIHYHYPWVPSSGIHMNFFVDGLSLLFCLLITGIGTLVFLYSIAYMKEHAYLSRFFAYMSMFMASMLGLVLSDNILSLFVFWELTSISSFFLIGFNNKSKAARKAALTALSITGGGGFLLLAGFVLLGYMTNSYSIQEMLQGPAVQAHAMYPWLLFFMLGGAFTKSAQFPLHFWLPSAMQAPAPVSTYLHSATMVKAGIYLLARLTPLLGDHIIWSSALIITGGVTMVYAAVQSLFRTDLKSVLAYSTISALGILVFLIGLGTPAAYLAAMVFILVHALYKATLFLITGIIDHQVHNRNITKLAGLRKVMPLVAVAGLLAALSSAGLPLTSGFIGKDLIYEATLRNGWQSWTQTGLAVLTNILLLYAGFQAGIRPFRGTLPQAFQQAKQPGIFMWGPPLLLGILGLVFGLFPALIDGALARPAAQALGDIAGQPALKIWHGFGTVLLLSLSTLAAGTLLYVSLRPTEQRQAWIHRLNRVSPQRLLYRITRLFRSFARFYTRTLQNGYLRVYLLTILCFAILLLGYKLYLGVDLSMSHIKFSPVTFYEIMILLVMAAAILYAVFSRSRLTAVAALSVVGYSICLLFVFFSAPDLAMTQFTIDTLTVVLFVLVLFRLPPYLQFTNNRDRIRDGIVAITFGTLISVIALQVLNEPPSRDISHFYGDNAYMLGKGKNVVNVILVDFRGLDTMVEITVLTIAAIGVYSLLKLKFLKEE